MYVTIYAHNDSDEQEWYGKHRCEQQGIDPESEEGKKIVELFVSKPCYEVAVDFDVDTGRPVRAKVNGVELWDEESLRKVFD